MYTNEYTYIHLYTQSQQHKYKLAATTKVNFGEEEFYLYFTYALLAYQRI